MTDVRQLLFSMAVTATSRILLLRDWMLGRIPWGGRLESCGAGISRVAISSGNNVLDAVLVKPESDPVRASVLICHGIGETVGHWLGVQQLLAENGVASLVFDYSGFGRSSGFFNASQCEQDAVSAFDCMNRMTAPLPVSILGFSLGSGVASAIVSRVPAKCLVLCAAFTSLRKAAVSVGIPRALQSLMPPIWDAENPLRNCAVPVLVVHGERDRLFRVRMAKELISFCGSQSELITIAKLGHNEPFYRPQLSYWGLIIARLV